MPSLKKLEAEYKEMGCLLNALQFSLQIYAEKASKYLIDPTLPNYRNDVYLPTKYKMENQKDKIVSKRQELRKLIKLKKEALKK